MRVDEALRGAARAGTGLALLSVERLRSGTAYSPFGGSYWRDPYPMYHSLRSRDPCHASLLTKSWVLTRYDDITTILRDGRFLVDRRKLSAGSPIPHEGGDAGPTMLTLDPPDHTRLRALVSKAFTQRSVEALRPRIEAIAHRRLDAVAEAGEMDAIRAFAHPLPAIVIAEMLGLPAEDHERFRRWADEIARAVGYADLADIGRASEAMRQLSSYLASIAEQRRREPQDDLLSALLQAEQEGDKLTMQEVLSTCRLLLNAGHAMTTNLIGNALIALLQHPEQMDALRRDPALITGAVEEALRYDSPVQATSRFVLEEVEIRGRRVAPRQQVTLLLGAANRDPEQFGRPDDFDITRANTQHLSFGQGIHFCLGAPLARMEAQVALTALIDRFPRLRLATERVEWQPHMLIRGPETLRLTF